MFFGVEAKYEDLGEELRAGVGFNYKALVGR